MNESDIILMIGELKGDVKALTALINNCMANDNVKIQQYNKLIQKVETKCNICPENEPAIKVLSQETFEKLNENYRKRINGIIYSICFVFLLIEFMQNFDKIMKFL
jgi:hypothetical protein